MARSARPVLEQRKTPVQERSNASVQAIHEATVQVLLSAGKEGLTTRKVADRAGVSVGTLYQYFPNKSALLQAVLRNHLEGLARSIHAACEQSKGARLDEIATTLVHEFMKVKLRHVETSRALYLVSDDVGGAEIARKNMTRNVAAVAALLESAHERLMEDSQVVASIVLSTMAGVSRRMLEASLRDGDLKSMQQGLTTMVRAYLQTCAVRVVETK